MVALKQKEKIIKTTTERLAEDREIKESGPVPGKEAYSTEQCREL